MSTDFDIFEVLILSFIFYFSINYSSAKKKVNDDYKKQNDYLNNLAEQKFKYYIMCKEIVNFRDIFIKRYEKYSEKIKYYEKTILELDTIRSNIKEKIISLKKNISSPRSVVDSTKDNITILSKKRDYTYDKISNLKKKLNFYKKIENELNIIKLLPTKFPYEPDIYLLRIIEDISILITQITNNFKLKVNTRLNIYKEYLNSTNFEFINIEIPEKEINHKILNEQSQKKFKTLLSSKKLNDKLNKFTNENEKKRLELFNNLNIDIQIFLGSNSSK